MESRAQLYHNGNPWGWSGTLRNLLFGGLRRKYCIRQRKICGAVLPCKRSRKKL
ncbi:hypothetical protein EVA_12862 [gut metagenome]|uniref:Uncharacterized protein n=1 Tax=gut metagenome TaxID=749906 RepID=J9FVN4_9ZZZZ